MEEGFLQLQLADPLALHHDWVLPQRWVESYRRLTLREDPLDMLRSWLDLAGWGLCSAVMMGLLLHLQRASDLRVCRRWVYLGSRMQRALRLRDRAVDLWDYQL